MEWTAMTLSKTIGAAIFAAVSLGAVSAASASTLTYDFTGTNSGLTLTKTFSTPGGPDLLVSAFSTNDSGSAVTALSGSNRGVGQNSSFGLFLKNASSDNSHTVDGLGTNDLLVLAFDSAVKIISATFRYAGIETNSNDGFAFFADNDADASVAGDLVFAQHDIGANSSGVGTYTFSPAERFTSKVFGVGAIWDAVVTTCKTVRGKKKCTSVNRYDSFKLASLKVEYTPPSTVPLPAALPLFAAGLGALGVVTRRRRRA
jgi:hypothetical protein